MGEAARDFLLQISSSHNPLQIKQEKLQQQQQQQQQREEPTTDEVELSLGLSLNGCFGVDPSKKTNLIRSSSIASFPSLVTSEHERPVPSSGLARTISLPGEQIQVLKRLEAKRKRLERRNSINKTGGKGESSVERCDEDGEVKRRKVEGTSEIFNGSTGRVDLGSVVAGFKSLQGSSSSIDVLAGADMKPPQGEILRTRSNFSEQRNTENIEAPTNLQPPAALPTPSTRVSPTPDSIRRMTGRAHSFSVVERNMLQEMPCVSTTGEGPNGKRVEGFLYKYKKGDEVRIVCVCHGKFLTPAEFVRHAGGGDVAHPLRHIVVNASPSACG